MHLTERHAHKRDTRRRAEALVARPVVAIVTAALLAGGITSMLPAAAQAQLTSTLTLSKIVNNFDGGTAVVGDFGIATNAGTLVWDSGVADVEGTVYTADALSVAPGTYTLSESHVNGYAESAWWCNADSSGWVNAGSFDSGSIEVGTNESVICTIKNDDISTTPTLTLKKTVINDYAGVATVTDFGIATNAGTPVWDGGVVGPDGMVYTAGALPVSSGGTNTFSEIDHGGYTEDDWWCRVNGGAYVNVGPYNAGSIVLNASEHAVCWIVNRDLPVTTPGLDIDPTSLGFGSVLLGATSSPDSVELSNDGSAALVLGTITITGANAGDFNKGTDTCSGQTLAPAATCDVAVTFSPAVLGARSADLNIPSNAASSPDTVGLSGTGTPAPATRIVDDKHSGFTKYNTGWKVQKAGYNGRSFWTVVRKNTGKRSAIWRAELSAPGRYQVWVRYPKSRATTKSALYRVYTKNGIVKRKKNQKYTAGKWTKLGTFEFGSVARVKLYDKTGERTSTGRKIVFDAVKFVPVSPAAAGMPIVVEPAIVTEEPGAATKLRLYPRTVSAVTGARKLVSAWTCPADDRSPFGPDRKPGTADDACDPVEAEWRLADEANARLSDRHGHRVIVQLVTETDNRLLATYEDLLQGVKLQAKPRPSGSVAPQLMGE